MNKEYVFLGRKLTAEQLIAFALIFLGFGVILFVILPQIDNIGLQREMNSKKQVKVEELRNSLNVLQSVSAEQVEQDLKLASSALPANKDVISVYTSIASLANFSNVQLRGFTIKVGDLYVKDESAKAEDVDISSATGFPTMDVIVTLSAADQKNLVVFTEELYKNFPIARINTVSAQENESMVEISFYYRPYDLSKIEGSDKLTPYSSEYADIIKILQER